MGSKNQLRRHKDGAIRVLYKQIIRPDLPSCHMRRDAPLDLN